MKKTFLTIMLAAGIGSACAATAAAWEFSSGTPSEQFMTGSGINLEGWSISSPVNSAASYTDWATVTGGDRNISTQTVGMWLDLSSLGSAATIYSFGETGSLRGLQLVYNGDGTFTSRRTGEAGQTFTIGQDVIDGGWFNLSMSLSTDTTTRKTDFQIFLNGENIVDTPQLFAGLNGGQNGTVTVGGGTTDEHSFSIADFKAYGTALTGQEIKEAWNMVPSGRLLERSGTDGAAGAPPEVREAEKIHFKRQAAGRTFPVGMSAFLLFHGTVAERRLFFFQWRLWAAMYW